jgi:hypothetical protein
VKDVFNKHFYVVWFGADTLKFTGPVNDILQLLKTPSKPPVCGLFIRVVEALNVPFDIALIELCGCAELHEVEGSLLSSWSTDRSADTDCVLGWSKIFDITFCFWTLVVA